MSFFGYGRRNPTISMIKSHVWDEWADEDGSIGKAYGYQLGVKHQYKEGMMDQVDRVIYDLKHTPFQEEYLPIYMCIRICMR